MVKIKMNPLVLRISLGLSLLMGAEKGYWRCRPTDRIALVLGATVQRRWLKGATSGPDFSHGHAGFTLKRRHKPWMPTEQRKKKGPKLEFDRRPVLWSLSRSQVRGPMAGPQPGRSPCLELRGRCTYPQTLFVPFPRGGARQVLTTF